MSVLFQQKLLLRQKMTAERNAQKFQTLEKASQQIQKKFQSLELFKTAKKIALYKAIRGEVDLDALFSNAWKFGKETFVPIFNPRSKKYEFAEITEKTELKRGNFGILEPVNPLIVSVSEIDLMVVPGVAFDFQGNRLGRGGGYYDRLLQHFNGISLAVAFDFQLLETIPCEPHDRPVDFVLTESHFVKKSCANF